MRHSAKSGFLVFITLAAGLLLAGGGCARRRSSERLSVKQASSPALRGYNLENLNTRVSPCMDFYDFAVGGWRARNPIPPDYADWGIIEVVERRNQETLRRILENDAASNASQGSNQRKLGDFYASCMDSKAIDTDALKPLEPEFMRISAIHDLPSLEAEIARLQTLGVDAPFVFTSQQDFKNSATEIGVAWQGGLGLPNCTYYTKQDRKSRQIRRQYLAHTRRMFQLLGDSRPRAAAEAAVVMQIEMRLARASMTPVELRDPKAVYHTMPLTELDSIAPSFSWKEYFQKIGQPELRSINVAQPKFFKVVNAVLTTVPLPDWKTYLRWHLIDAAAHYLSDPFVDEDFAFERILTGAQKLQPRWQRCVNATDAAMGMALGKQYVERMFPPASKQQAVEMVNNLIAALGSDISDLTWMGSQTRQYALAKLAAMQKKIGYPGKWRDYSSLEIRRGPYVANVLNADSFEFHRELNKIGRPVDRAEWEMTPPTVNAYYDPSMNEIVFPAGILQPPFFDPTLVSAINYGDTGATIGHEMTHGFDDEGRQFDAHGNLKNWWTARDLARFEQRGTCIVNQFNGYTVDGGLHENGKLEEGESIADLGGLVIAYKAFEKSIAGKPRIKIGGFTPEQLFFLGYAESWEENIRPQLERLLVMTDPHPIARFRVNGPLSDMSEFARAWGCKTGDPMVRPPQQQCKIW
jgi:putative endopeptidase